MDTDLVLEITSIQEVVKVLRVDDNQKTSSTIRKAVDQEWNSETPTFRRETNQEELMKERKKGMDRGKNRQQRELNKVRCISQIQKDK